MSNAIRLITFDVTNTIIKVRGSVGLHYRKAALSYGFVASETKFNDAFRASFHETDSKYPSFGIHHGLTSKQWWDFVVQKTFRDVGMTSNSAILQQICNSLYDSFCQSSKWQPIAGARDVLAQLNNDYMLGVCSNFDERLDLILAALQLDRCFRFILTPPIARCAKPERKFFELALQQVKCGGHEAVHVGDSYSKDYVGATSAGLNAILIIGEHEQPPAGVNPRFCIRTIDQLPHALSRISQSPRTPSSSSPSGG